MLQHCSGHWFDDINWVGFYLRRPHSDDLVLGPFSASRPVARFEQERVSVERPEQRAASISCDVAQFKGHIACDSASSELVAPVL